MGLGSQAHGQTPSLFFPFCLFFTSFFFFFLGYFFPPLLHLPLQQNTISAKIHLDSLKPNRVWVLGIFLNYSYFLLGNFFLFFCFYFFGFGFYFSSQSFPL